MKSCPNPAREGDDKCMLVEQDSRCTLSFQGWVKCDWCGMRGPVSGGRDEVVELWDDLPRMRKKK